MAALTPLQRILASFRAASVTEREKGTYFEELICVYLRNEPTYADLYSDIWMLADVPAEFGISTTDTGIDLVARTRGTGEFHAIQCKFYAEDHRIQKSDIDSFFTASGQKPFTHRIIVTTTNEWTEHAEAALFNQQPPVTGKSVSDKSTVIYNEFITLTGIPLEAYDYVVNGKPAIEWVMERQAVTTDKDSGIVNDANLWATETTHNPRYPPRTPATSHHRQPRNHEARQQPPQARHRLKCREDGPLRDIKTAL